MEILCSGVIGVLVDSGRPIDAINLAYAFELTDQFEPVQLLKAYLKEVKSMSTVKNGKVHPGLQVIFFTSILDFSFIELQFLLSTVTKC